MTNLVYWQNNGIAAVVTAEDYGRITSGEFDSPGGGTDWRQAMKAGIRIFTFASANRMIRQLAAQQGKHIFTGTSDDWEQLRRRHPCGEKSVYVPFSRGPFYDHEDSYFVVSEGDFHAVFGEKAWTVRFPASNPGEKE